MGKNPFGDDAQLPGKPVNPFGDPGDEDLSAAEAATKIEQSARKIRALRMQLGAEGMTLQATRELIDEVATGLESAAKALRRFAAEG